ncbi:hypothetical protein, partial [Thermococcus sp.]
GVVLIEDTSSQWLIEINKGRVTKAVEHTTNGISKVGDAALKSLVKELPCLIDHLEIKLNPMNGLLSTDAKVKAQYLLKEVLEILLIKRALDTQTS